MSEQFSVLIVEDDVNLASTLQDILHDEGYRTVAAHDGRTALALCSQEAFDLAILDLKLPDTSGTKLAEDINKLLPETEYIINTGYASLDTAIEAIKLRRIISYETKPVDIDRFLSLARQVAERRKAQAALKQSEKRFQALIENISDLIVIVDAEGKIQYESPSVEHMGGYKPKERIGKSVFEYVHPEDVAKVAESFSQLRQNASVATRIEIRARSKDGSWRTVEVSFNNMLNNPNVGGIVVNLRDVTERKKAEEALSREKERAQKYLDIAGVLIVAIDANQTVTLINRKGAEILGYPQNEIIGKNWFDDFVPARFRSLLKTRFPKIMAGEVEAAEYYEVPVLTRAGDERIIETHNTTCRDASGKIVGTLSSGNDITERKKAEQALLESERHYAALVKNLTDAVFLFKDEVIIWCNDKVEEIYGYSKEELLGKHASFFYSPDVVPFESIETVSAILNERGSFHGTASFRKKDYSTIYLEYSLSHMSGEDSVETIVVARDITERKKAEEVLRESEANYRELADSISDIFFALDNNLRFIYWNKASAEMTGIKAIDAIGKNIYEFFPDDDSTRNGFDKCRKALAEQQPQTLEIEYTLRQKNYFFEVYIYPSKLGLSVFVRDITQRKQAEKARERLLAELEDKTRELEQIVYVTSHDLRSPLVNVQGFTRELDQSFKEVNEVLKSKGISPQLRKKLTPIINEDIPYAIKYILTSSAKMDSLLSGLLRISRLGRAALSIKQLDMNKLMAEVVDSVEFQIKESGAKVEVDNLPPCYGDETQINQVFSNLLDNALKFLKPKRKGKIKIWGKTENEEVVYCVEDNGIGIDEKDRQVIFEIFRRLDPGSHSGEGLGLTIVRKILDRHGGRVWVESERGKGSRFFVSLSCKEEQE